MSQITVFARQDRVIDVIIVSKNLGSKLEGARIASFLDFFTVELLEELSGKFLRSVLDKFNLYDKSKDEYYNFNKATEFALNLYPWYKDLTGLICAIENLRFGGSGIVIQLTHL